MRIGPAFAMIGELRQTAVLIKENNRAYMTFVIHDKVPVEQVLGIIAGSLDRKVGRDLGLLEEKDAAFGLSTVSPDSWRDIQSDISDFTGCATAP